MGAGLPAGVRGSVPAARALPWGSHRGADGDRRRGDPERHRRETLRRPGGADRTRLRPPQHQAYGGDEARVEAAVAELRRPPRGRERHRLLPLAQEDRGDRRHAGGRRRSGAPLSRRHEEGRAGGPPEHLHDRSRRGDRRHHRLRHGDRQGGRALRLPHRPAGQHRGLLPGDRSGRAGWRARRGAHALRSRRHQDAAAVHRGGGRGA